MTLQIRPLIAADKPAWAELWRGYLEFYKTTLPEAQYALTFARLLDEARPQWGLLALVDGRPAGLVHYLFHAHNWQDADICYLQDLYAAPEARGTGLGRGLIEAVRDRARAAGSSGLYWMTQEGNATARQLYDRLAEKTDFIKYRMDLE
ncbi:Ribosomal protein S18 acetylase RimI [Pseudooceanicola antarcticus]|uniref:N-acetyltransferase n=1 Tax=Pseudooceanicola antarcticus TaxID=1247613 RepID=A0A285J0F8_9RHOB|nr:GNAT family N-acetyltransferase [Pseudooceanicola antarcticus]PJE29949.1 N-acetyltransferase [Pseudooceanicola antarcticus]SNY53779.1 Ribosomal protein S18 acetylase RimI [Pseudooceanicola antarcticus]